MLLISIPKVDIDCPMKLPTSGYTTRKTIELCFEILKWTDLLVRAKAAKHLPLRKHGQETGRDVSQILHLQCSDVLAI